MKMKRESMSVAIAETSIYQQRIDELRRIKVEYTNAKIEGLGRTMGIDDYGSVPWPEPIPFEVMPTHPSGGCYGATAIANNFRAWLEAHPVIIHPTSSLCGGWVSSITGVGGWRPEDKPVHLDPLIQKYHIAMTGCGAMNHLGPDMRIGLDRGWGGLLEKIHHYRQVNHPAGAVFYDAEETFVLAVQDWIRRHVKALREKAGSETDPATKDNLLSMAEMNEWLVDGAPRTLREACQFLAWFQSVDRMWALGGALSQLDELLRPFYETDRAAGLESDEAVTWHLASLFFNDTHYSQIGGPDVDGRDVTSPVSFLILDAAHLLGIPTNLAVRVHDGLDPVLLRRTIEYMFEDGSGPCFACSKGLDEGFARNGVPVQLARLRAKVGCNWTALPGIEYACQDVTRMCLIGPFQVALHEMLDSDDTNTMDNLWSRYVHHLGTAVDVIKQAKDWHMRYHADNCPEIVLNLFCHGPIERGLDVAGGGLDMYNFAVDGLGLATVADSFAAIEQRVVEEGRLTWEELNQHLQNDFAGAENVRLMLKNIPRFGAGGTRGDGWARRVGDTFVELVKDTPTPDGYNIIPGFFSHGNLDSYGEGLGATPNGRRAGTPISHSANPDPGFLPGGQTAPTAKASAVAAVQPGYGNTSPLQLDLDRDMMAHAGGVEAVESLIKTHNEEGGTLINLNVVSREQILEAYENPEKYPDLVVRVTGFSAYFQTLPEIYRKMIVERLLSESAA